MTRAEFNPMTLNYFVWNTANVLGEAGFHVPSRNKLERTFELILELEDASLYYMYRDVGKWLMEILNSVYMDEQIVDRILKIFDDTILLHEDEPACWLQQPKY